MIRLECYSKNLMNLILYLITYAGQADKRVRGDFGRIWVRFDGGPGVGPRRVVIYMADSGFVSIVANYIKSHTNTGDFVVKANKTMKSNNHIKHSARATHIIDLGGIAFLRVGECFDNASLE